MKIRLATINDYAELMKLYNGFVGENRYSKHDNDALQKVIANSNNGLFVAENEDKLIGFASISVRDVVRYPRPIAELDELYVSPSARMHGIGLALMNAVEDFARERNCFRLFIESAYQHKVAHHFYERNGYKNNGYHFVKNL